MTTTTALTMPEAKLALGHAALPCWSLVDGIVEHRRPIAPTVSGSRRQSPVR